MRSYNNKEEKLDFIRAFEQGWIQYKSGFVKFLPLSIGAVIPTLFFYINIPSGIVLTLLFQGFFFLLLAENIVANGTLGKGKVQYTRHLLWKYLKNGFVVTLFLLPLLAIGFLLLIIPSIILFSLFMFSFFIVVTKDKFAIDACMESLRQGFGYRLHLFLLSLVFYAGILILYMISGFCSICFVALNAIVIPYYFCVIFEFYEQLEKK